MYPSCFTPFHKLSPSLSLSLSLSLCNHINNKPLFFQTLAQSYYTKTLIFLSLNLSRDLAAFSGDVIPANS